MAQLRPKALPEILTHTLFPEPGGHGSVLELSTVLAMIVYALLAWGIVRVIEISRRRQTMYRA
ncbi:MAG TPA: hypothetical protein VGS80_26465 [Ktedonobacterales bacterium]|nr:hypothetical protein [Ktedonobacterales bacterium]